MKEKTIHVAFVVARGVGASTQHAETVRLVIKYLIERDSLPGGIQFKCATFAAVSAALRHLLDARGDERVLAFLSHSFSRTARAIARAHPGLRVRIISDVGQKPGDVETIRLKWLMHSGGIGKYFS